RQRRRIELPLVQVLDVDAHRLERLLRKILFAQDDQRDVVAFAIEAGDHPAEEPLDAVHPRAFPAEVIAHLKDVQPFLAHAFTAGSRWPTMRAGMPTAIAPSGTASQASDATATMAPAPTVTP